MTLTIMLLWILGIALLVGVAVVRGRATTKHKSPKFAAVDTASADALLKAFEATLSKTTESADRAQKGVWVRSHGLRVQSNHGEFVVKSTRALSGAVLPQTTSEKSSGPAKGKEPLTR